MSSLIITKQTGNFFSLVLDGGNPIISEQNRLTTIGNFCNFKTANGANLILKQNILYSDITIVTGVSHVPTSINDLWISLLDAGFFDGLATTGGSSTIDKFTELLDTFSSYIGRDGQLLVVNESEQKIETISISLFSEDDRTKLEGIETGAEVNVQSNWNETNPLSDAFIQNKPDLGLGYTAEDVANKVSEITGYDTDLYPNEKATHDALDLKLNISDLPTNLTLYPTNVASDVAGYVKMVTDIHAPDYNTVAVDVSTPAITGTGQLVSQRITDAGVLIGQPGVFNFTTFGNIRRLSGSGTAEFYTQAYHRDSLGVETLVGTSSPSVVVVNGTYAEFTTSGVWDDGEFSATDRIVIKSYANRIVGGSDPVYQFQFGGTTPVRTLLPVPFSVVDAGYELKANKQNSLTPDGTGTKYPTVDAVNNALPTTYSKVVYVNATSPTTATIFDTENPPVTNDNLLKNDTANLYIGTDASTWVYLTGTGYVTKIVPSTSNFNTFGTTVDAGNSKTSHITRSGAMTLAGPLNILNLKIATTPTTSAGSYDILTRNSSTTALEKKLVSDFLQTTGDQSFTGVKSSTISGSNSSSLSLTNQSASTGAASISINISATGSQNGQRGISINNDNAGANSAGSQAIYVSNNNTGQGIELKNISNGQGLNLSNWSTGIGAIYGSRTDSTGDLMRFTKNIATTTYINHLGEIITMSPTATNQVATKGYADAKITQTITNGVTDKSPSEDAVYDATFDAVKTIIFENDMASVTGSVSEVLAYSTSIPANKLPAKCMPNLKIKASKSGTAGTSTLRVKVNTVNDFATAIIIGAYTSATSTNQVTFVRNLNILSGSMYVNNATTSIINDEAASTAGSSSITYDPSVIQYWFFSIQNTDSGDSTRIRGLKLVN